MIVAWTEGVRDTAWIDVQLLFQTLSAGAAHTCGISATGNTYCWGEGSMGRLGSGTDRSSAVPVLVDGGLVFSVLSAGGESTCALTGFAAFCWGSNNARQLGTGGKFDSWVPAAVAGSHVFQVLEVGTVHACDLAGDGGALCWGSDWGGQIGNGARPRPFEPDTVAGGLRFAAISPGWSLTCGATTEGVPFCWPATVQRRSPGGWNHSTVYGDRGRHRARLWSDLQWEGVLLGRQRCWATRHRNDSRGPGTHARGRRPLVRGTHRRGSSHVRPDRGGVGLLLG
jgi:hypothetical protein